jgi:hypothetical protein
LRGDTILLGGEPFFPLILWASCPYEIAGKIAQGINLFMGNGCGDDTDMIDALSGRAFAVAARTGAEETGASLIGWYYPDEWDEHLPETLSADDLRALAPDPAPGLLSFLTLTNHFYSGAAPLPQGRGIYSSMVQLPDVVGFDIYPLQIWCRDDRFGDIYSAQRELDGLSGGKPSFQWIEVREMQCDGEHLRPDAETVRAETWLAIAGGADGIGYFPNNWSDEVGLELGRTNRQIDELAAAILADPITTKSDIDSVRVGARVLNGATYIIAVNTSKETIEAKIEVPEMDGRALDVVDEQRQLPSSGDTFSDDFAPLAVHLYVAPPLGWHAGEDFAAAATADAGEPEAVPHTGFVFAD